MRRRAFTITELLVAMALIVFIMYILSEAFDAGLTTFRRLKSISDMNDRLRTASNTIRRLLAADHFEGKKRLSDPNFWQDGPPREGFFRIYQRSRGSQLPGGEYSGTYWEGNDQDSIPSFRTGGLVVNDPNNQPYFSATDHALHFTVKLRGNNRGDFFTGSVPGPTSPTPSPLLQLPNQDGRMQDPTSPNVNAPWAEIVLFTQPSVNSVGVLDTANGTPLNILYLRQRLLVPDNNLVAALPGAPVPAGQDSLYSDWSTQINGNALYFNSPRDLTVPTRRLPMSLAFRQTDTSFYWANQRFSCYPALTDQYGVTSLQGADVLLNDVLSFDVRVLLHGGTEFVSLYHSSVAAYDMGNPSFPATGPRVFDTWSSLQDDQAPDNDYSSWATRNTAKTIPLYQDPNTGAKIRIRAIQISIRIWDSRTEQTRQVSVVQEL
jgi:hypothetical protein